MNKAKMFILLTFLVILTFTKAGLSLPTLEITVYTNKTSYSIEENIYVYGDVKIDETPVENATVALEVRDPSASPVIVRAFSTNASGNYNLSFKLSSDASTGTYTVNVTCNYDGERATSATSFNLEETSVFIVTVNMGRPTYQSGEAIEIFGEVTQNNAPVLGALVAVEVQDPKNTPVAIRVLETDADGLYSLTFQLPTGSPAGIYNVHASVNYENQNAVANTTFQVKQEIFADINGDGAVNILDIALVAKAWGSYLGHPRWDPRCDLDGNEIINIIDIALVAREYT